MPAKLTKTSTSAVFLSPLEFETIFIPPAGAMEGDRPHIAEVIPKAGLVYSEKGQLGETLSKPKIMPLKSISLERIEAMEREAKQLAETMGQREKEEKEKEEKARKETRGLE